MGAAKQLFSSVISQSKTVPTLSVEKRRLLNIQVFFTTTEKTPTLEKC
jgi:hypothetical protein